MLFSKEYTYAINDCGFACEDAELNEKEHFWLNKIFFANKGDCHRIWFVIKGKGVIKTTLGNYELLENHAYYFPKDSIITAYYEKRLEQFFIDFNTDSQRSLFDNFYLQPICLPNTAIIKDVLETIDKTANDNTGFLPFCNDTAINFMLNYFFRHMEKKEKNARLDDVVNYIDEHFCDEDFSVEKLAKEFHYSPQHIKRLFKGISNIPPKQYIVSKRIAKAQKLLLATNKNVTEISVECGFNDQHYFSRLFKSTVGHTPREFRNIHTSKNPQ